MFVQYCLMNDADATRAWVHVHSWRRRHASGLPRGHCVSLRALQYSLSSSPPASVTQDSPARMITPPAWRCCAPWLCSRSTWACWALGFAVWSFEAGRYLSRSFGCARASRADATVASIGLIRCILAPSASPPSACSLGVLPFPVHAPRPKPVLPLLWPPGPLAVAIPLRRCGGRLRDSGGHRPLAGGQNRAAKARSSEAQTGGGGPGSVSALRRGPR